MQKIRVGVLMGGRSIEREVSLNTGRTICDHLDTARYEVVPLFQKLSGQLYILPARFVHRGKISDFEHRLQAEAQEVVWDELKSLVDVIYIAQHGRYGEDGSLQGFLEVLGIPYVGSKIFASALGMHKRMQKDFLQAAGIAVPRDYKLDDVIAYPVVVKPCQEGSSLGVSIAHNQAELQAAVERAATVTPGVRQQVIIEEKIEGMEFTCIVITDVKTGEYVALPPTEIVPETEIYEYDQKYMPGRAHKFTPARCAPQQLQLIQDTCVQVMNALSITHLARIDGFLTNDGRVVIIDPNTFSGMAPSSFAFTQAAQVGMSHTQFINHLLMTELRQRDLLAGAEIMQSETETKKIRVAVLMGGASAERETSLDSGRNITYKLSPHKYEAIPIFITHDFKPYIIDQAMLVHNSTREIEHELSSARKILWSDLPQIADFVFVGLHGGLGENGGVQGMLETLGLPYNGSGVLASALCMDKFKTNNFLRQKGFAVPEGRLVAQGDPLPTDMPFPLIVKPHDDGCSVLVQKAHNGAELEQAVQAIFDAGRLYALIEECIVGMELTVGVLGNEDPQALPPSQAIASGGILSIEEKFLPGAGENQTPALLPEAALARVKQVIKDAFVALGCRGYARIDCFYTTDDRVVILEVNTLPGMTPATCIFHQAAELGMKPMDFIDQIITLGFEAQKGLAAPLNLKVAQAVD